MLFSDDTKIIDFGQPGRYIHILLCQSCGIVAKGYVGTRGSRWYR